MPLVGEFQHAFNNLNDAVMRFKRTGSYDLADAAEAMAQENKLKKARMEEKRGQEAKHAVNSGYAGRRYGIQQSYKRQRGKRGHGIKTAFC